MIDINEERLKTLKKLGFLPKRVLDIGAFQGAWSKIVRGIWPATKISMIEANIDYEAQLLAKKLGQVVIALLGKEQGEEKIYYASHKEIATGNSIYKEQTWYFEDAEERLMQVETLSHLSGRKKWSVFDLIKIDTQGSELEIVEGGREIIQQAEFV